MGMSGKVRIGIVGAGQVGRSRHLPGFLGLPGVEVVGVCNLKRESSGRVAREFGLAKVYGSWGHLVDDDDVDAVVIATWPYLHCPITLAAFDAGKHVLTQGRMAMNAREAQRMLDRSLEVPNLTAMVVPSPLGIAGDQVMRDLVGSGYLGDLREVHITGFSSDLADPESPLTWRQMTRYSGFNMLDLGNLYESTARWLPSTRRVFASATKQLSTRLDPETGENARVGTADSVQVITSYKGGASGTFRLSGVVWHASGSSAALFGSAGSLVYDFKRDEIRGAPRGQADLRPIPIPEDRRGGWTVEADFIAAVRGERPVVRTTFVAGVRAMQFTEAVARSSRHGQPVDLPLQEFSNPSL